MACEAIRLISLTDTRCAYLQKIRHPNNIFWYVSVSTSPPLNSPARDNRCSATYFYVKFTCDPSEQLGTFVRHTSLRSVNMFRSLCKYVVVSSNVRAYSSEFWFIVKRGVRGSVRERRHHESFDIPVVVSKREETLAGTCL